MAPRRRFLMVANFKSSGTVNDVVDLARSFGATHWEHWGPEEPEDRTAQVVVAPSLLHLHLVREHLGPAARRIELGAQDVYPESGSHHTGEHTVEMLRDSQVNWVILGHSERRRDPILSETNELVAAKARHALGAGMGAIICVGETAEERAHGHAVKVVLSQLEAVASQLSQWDNVAIAYEPLWAIGTGAVASLDQVQEMHEALRHWIRTNVSPVVADSTRIIYGGAPCERANDKVVDSHQHAGSVSAVNCEPLARLRDVDGFLVGGASVRLVHSGTFPGCFSEFAAITSASTWAHHEAFNPGEAFDPVKPGTVLRGGEGRQRQGVEP